ncbi:uncharacterized protein YlxW (UPF0749 family) [Isoptericola sp. CG 20/1183]|uniref:Uncharacterized protein YlxW (UPF0749 family) n=1 Tax=Isoptericola halotolerans TaxID=300560 RepID=A0ABX5EBH0_9MICO|nr:MULTISPECIES: DUF881 domain-containing protein [Isoptericola]PRZ04450.1 uncharacterized protein YlxW (UPF0749 family) [Isoptericola halotolerans]PRZ04652.1 uncharacterized protein YlxW (UPF0749 family) [Isoptericola sp. CG 20/1183]
MTGVPPARRPDASMTLLVEVMEKPLDAGYAEAARRRAEGEVPSRGAGPLLLLLVAVLLGLMTVAAAQQLRAPSEGPSAREVLEQEISERQASAEALRAQTVALTEEIEQLQAEALSAADQGLLDQLRLDGVVTGATAVSGPGLELTLSDSDADLGGVEPSDTRVQAVDLQTVVNALWASGAEAISVGDQRLTSLSAIRHAGEAILVDLVPLPGPSYVVRAIGDPEGMQAAYARTGAPAYTQYLSSEWGIGSSMNPVDEIDLPSVGGQGLRYAEPWEPDVEDSVEDSQEESP